MKRIAILMFFLRVKRQTGNGSWYCHSNPACLGSDDKVSF